MALLIQEPVSSRGDEVAVVDAAGTATWAQLGERVDRLVAALRGRGLATGATVALMAGNQRESLEVTLACLHGGWVVVPVNWHWVGAELAYVLDDSDAAALVVADDWVDVATDALAHAAEQGSAVPSVRVAVSADPPEGFESYEAAIAQADPAGAADPVRGGVMFYTSGTTGFPKGVKGVLAQTGDAVEIWQLLAGAIAGTIELAPRDPVLLLCGPIYHSAQWVFTLSSLLSGARVVLQHRFDAEAVLAGIDEHAVTNVHLVPAQMVRLLRAPEAVRQAFSGTSLHRVHHGAAPCPDSVKRALIEWWGPVIWEYYGGTEGGFITMVSSEEWLERPGTVGRATPTIELTIRGADGEPVPTGEVGDVCFRSLLGSSFEYHKAPEKTAAAHREPGVGTLGDVGYLDEDGYLFLSDRRIDMIISGGVNIYPAEIERVLASHPGVADVAVFGIPHDEMGEQVLATIEPTDGMAIDPDALTRELEALCRAELAGYKCPRRWVYLPELPRTDSGKLQKRLLRDPYWSDAASNI